MDEETKRWAEAMEKLAESEKAKNAKLIVVPRDKKLSQHLIDLRNERARRRAEGLE